MFDASHVSSCTAHNPPPLPQVISQTQGRTWRYEMEALADSSSSMVQLSLISRHDNGNDRMDTESVPLSRLSAFSLFELNHDGPVKFELSVLLSGPILDPSAGRFLSEDPIRFGGGTNSYRYVTNNPVACSACR